MADFHVRLYTPSSPTVPTWPHFAAGTYYFMIQGRDGSGKKVQLFSQPAKISSKWTAAQLSGVPPLSQASLYVSFNNYIYYIADIHLPPKTSFLTNFKDPTVAPVFVPIPFALSPMVIRTWLGIIVLFAAILFLI